MWFQNISAAIKRRLKTDLGRQGNPSSKRNGDPRLSLRALRQLDRLQLNASRYLPGSAIGQRASLRRVPSSDFLDHRLYIPGDDIRFIDWKASARHEHNFIKLGNQPREVTVYLLLDCSASMSWRDGAKKSCLLQIALTLAHLALGHGETLYIVPLGAEHFPPLGPVHGKGQIPGIINDLKRLQVQGQGDLCESMLNFRRAIARQSGLVYVLSDLLDVDRLDNLLERFRAPSWDLVFLQILHRDELEPSFSGNFELVDCETGKRNNYDINLESREKYIAHITTWMARLEADCVEYNHFYALIPADWELDNRILPRLRELKSGGTCMIFANPWGLLGLLSSACHLRSSHAA